MTTALSASTSFSLSAESAVMAGGPVFFLTHPTIPSLQAGAHGAHTLYEVLLLHSWLTQSGDTKTPCSLSMAGCCYCWRCGVWVHPHSSHGCTPLPPTTTTAHRRHY